MSRTLSRSAPWLCLIWEKGVLAVAEHSSLSLTLPKSACGKTPGMTPTSSAGVIVDYITTDKVSKTRTRKRDTREYCLKNCIEYDPTKPMHGLPLRLAPCKFLEIVNELHQQANEMVRLVNSLTPYRSHIG